MGGYLEDEKQFINVVGKSKKSDWDARYILENLVHFPDLFNLLEISSFTLKCFSIEYFSGLVMKIISSIPILIASSTAYCTKGLSIIGSISLGIAFEAGKNLDPKPATGSTAFFINLHAPI